MEKIPTSQLDIKEGTITFRVKEEKVIWNDNKITVFFDWSSGGNSIFIIKDDDNKFKFFHVLLGYGKTEIEFDVSQLSSSTSYFFVITWNLNKREVKLYLDGKLVREKKVEYSIKRKK